MDSEKFLTIFLTAFITFISTKLWDWWRETKKTKYEEKKLLRKALHHLTNLWQTLQTLDFDRQNQLAIRLAFETLSQMGAKPEDLKKLEFKDSDLNSLISFQTQYATDKIKILEEQVEIAVDKLAEIQPLIASELRIMQSTTQLDPAEKLIQGQLNDGKERSEYQLNMIINVENQHFQIYRQKLIERLTPYILRIASDIDKKTLKSTENHLQLIEKERADLFSGEITEDMKFTAKTFGDMLMNAHINSTQNSSQNEEEINKDKGDE